MLRCLLKEIGVHTTKIDSQSIEHELSLSALLDFPEVKQLLGENLSFELQSIFAHSLGPNLRNQTAHGLLDDNEASALHSIYAWWMVLRIVVRSIIIEDPREW